MAVRLHNRDEGPIKNGLFRSVCRCSYCSETDFAINVIVVVYPFYWFLFWSRSEMAFFHASLIESSRCSEYHLQLDISNLAGLLPFERVIFQAAVEFYRHPVRGKGWPSI